MGAEFVLIGVDGGATEVKTHKVRFADAARLAKIDLGVAAASRRYQPLPDFAPLSVVDQIAQRDAGAIQLSSAEEKQGGHWVDAAADSIAQVAEASGDAKGAVLVGMGMPGLKTADRRGIAVINNGPRIPDYLERLEHGLRCRGVRLAAPIAELGSDADYCGLGEEFAADGLFRDVKNAYYVGGGTGVADALKLHGRLVTLDESKSWIMKSWQMPGALGPTFEKLVAAKSINECFAALEGQAPPLGPPVFPEQSALEGDPVAHALLAAVAVVLAELLFERISTIHRGRADASHRGSAYAALRRDHPYLGTVLERIVIGQRLGTIYAQGPASFADRVQGCLGEMISRSGGGALAEAYLSDGSLREDLIVPSMLRAAPALGAAVAALRSYAGER